jgi:rod shape-determining protein MreC
LLITDRNHALPVQVDRNGLRGIVVGTGRYRSLELPYLPINADIQEGDQLITSGLGGRFPSGYPVARVVNVKRDPARPFALVEAAPTAELDRIREVLLLTTTPVHAHASENSDAAGGDSADGMAPMVTDR